MTKTPPSRLARRVWTLYLTAQRDAALKAVATETDPERRRILRAAADRYQTIIVTGVETADISS